MAEDYIEFNEFRTAETAEPNNELLLQTSGETKRITVEAYNRPLNQAIENTRNEVNLLSDEVDRVNEKIPSTATPDNQLTTQDYVNEAIQTNSAVNRGSFETYADLMAYEGTVTRNDYAYVADDESHKHESWRYKWNDDTHEWTPEYRINEAPMTLEQLAALNSGITAEKVSKIPDTEVAQINDTKTDTTHAWSGAKVVEEIQRQLSFNYPDWKNKVQRDSQVYTAEEDGWILNTGTGPYAENVWIDISNDEGTTWTRIVVWYDDINGNTKGSNALIPVRKGDYYKGQGPEGTGYTYWFIPKRKN